MLEYVTGSQSITQFCDAHRLTLSTRLRLFCRVCEAVEYAHRHGLIHRDIKPGNILAEGDNHEDTHVRLVDFGIVKQQGVQSTETGVVVGTPGYIAPEILAGGLPDARSDVYSLGVVLFQLCTGLGPSKVVGLHGEGGDFLADSSLSDEAAIRRGFHSAEELRSALELHFPPLLRGSTAHQPARRFATPQVLRHHIEEMFLNPTALMPKERMSVFDRLGLLLLVAVVLVLGYQVWKFFFGF